MNSASGAPTSILIVVAVVLTLLATLCSAAESAISRLSRAGAEDLVEDKRKYAAKVEFFVHNKHQTLVALRSLRVTFQTLATVAVTLAVAQSGLPWWGVGLISVAIAAAVVLIMVAIVPVRVGRRWPETTALFLAPLMSAALVLVRPFTPLARLWRRVRPAPAQTEAEARQEMAEDLRELVDDLGESESLDIEEEDREMLRSVFELGTTLVREVMVPRTDMVTINLDVPTKKALGLFVKSGFSRVPVIGDDVDDVRGVLYLKDVVARTHRNPELMSTPVHQFMREPVFVPEVVLADDLLRRMQSESFHMALVVDEWGGIAGLVTLEDLLEEVVGELADEHDRTALEPEEVSPGVWRVPARLPIDQLGELFDLEIDDEDVDSAGGLLTKALGKVALVGAEVEVFGLKLVAESAQGRRRQVSTILASRLPQAKED